MATWAWERARIEQRTLKSTEMMEAVPKDKPNKLWGHGMKRSDQVMLSVRCALLYSLPEGPVRWRTLFRTRPADHVSASVWKAALCGSFFSLKCLASRGCGRLFWFRFCWRKRELLGSATWEALSCFTTLKRLWVTRKQKRNARGLAPWTVRDDDIVYLNHHKNGNAEVPRSLVRPTKRSP